MSTSDSDIDSDIDTVLASCREKLGDPSQWTAPDGYHHSLALCIIDAVQSTGAHYSRVVQVVDRYRAYRRAQGAAADTDGSRDLLRTFEEVGGSWAWAGKIGNYKRRCLEDASVLKARTIQDAADNLHRLHIDSVADLLEAAHDVARFAAVKEQWLAVSSETNEVNWTYFLMLAGVPGVDPQRLSSHFIADALGLDHANTQLTRELITAAARQLHLSTADLDHAIWRWESNSRQPSPIHRQAERVRSLRVVA